MALDLHVHSTASDGTVPPRELVRLAHELGLTALAIADHDSVAGVAPALAEAERLGMTLIPAVELSATHDGRGIHVLGYFVDHESTKLLGRLERLREARLRRAEQMVAQLTSSGHDLSMEDVLRLSADGAVGRSHVARALVETGTADSIEDAFARFVGRGKPFYIPKPAVTPQETIRTIREAGGVAVLAHPGVTGIDDLLPVLIDAGLRGIEVYHAEHDAPTRARYLALARERDLVPTGGSDYHGPDQRPEVGLGEAGVPDSVLGELEAAARR